uniref:Uncharacterized protein n=1 Tax=Romanomermis culicivorax TaxID=13658 RepID=A0A915IBD8_ROMCU
MSDSHASDSQLCAFTNKPDSDSSPNDDATNIVMDEKTPSQISKGVKTIVPYPHVDDQNMSVISNATEVNSTAWNLYHNGTDPECPNSKANGTNHGVVIWIWTSIIILILIMIALILMLVIMVQK